jgi:Fic family protein
MVYTEVQDHNGIKYYYRVISERNGKKVSKRRIYLGKELEGEELAIKEKEADRELRILNALLTDEEIEILEGLKKEYSEQPTLTYENRYESFASRFTHDSTAIEGNTLSLMETAFILFNDLVPGNKSLMEINEVRNHKKAFDFLLRYEEDINKDFICHLHLLTMTEAHKPGLEEEMGRYRTMSVRITGVEWRPPPPEEVPKEMKELLTWYSKNKLKLHPVILADHFHIVFETIHPFVDGNGRVGRLLMNFILHKNGYPMVNILNDRRFEYYDALRAGHLDGNFRPFLELLIDHMKESDLLF